MLHILLAKNRFFSDMWAMNSYFLFNFANYYDKDNESFGNIRVFNDDFLSSKSWFDMHPHKYYEIVTIMIDGTITHKDSLWNNEKISKNQMQVTNASTWITHSEINQEKEDLKLYQIWFSPAEIAKEPIYYTANFSETDFKNNLYILASGLVKNKNKLSSKVNIKRWIFDKGKVLNIYFDKYVFLYITSWKIRVNWKKELSKKDQLRAFGEKEIQLEFLEKTDFIVIESE